MNRGNDFDTSRLSLRSTWVPRALALAVLLLVFGTQMPGAWKDAALNAAGLSWYATKVAHFTLFAAIAWLSRQAPLRWNLLAAMGLALVLACGTELLQFWARDRHPELHDVAIDMAGAAVGLLLARWQNRGRVVA